MALLDTNCSGMKMIEEKVDVVSILKKTPTVPLHETKRHGDDKLKPDY